MIRRLKAMMPAALCLAATAAAQTRFDNGLTVFFGKDRAAHIHTESTKDKSLVSTKGVVAIDEGEVSHRMVLGPNGTVLFAYDISLAPVPNDSRAYTIRVKPADPDHFIPQYVTFAPEDQLRISVWQLPELSGTHTVRPDGNIVVPQIGEVHAAGNSPSGLAGELKKRLQGRIAEPRVIVTVLAARRNYPTIAAMREFPVVRIGEAVNLDILYNPNTGEKIFDVIQPVDRPAEKRRIAPEDEISLEQMRISINGTLVHEARNSWMIGGAVKLQLPRLGTLYLVVKPSTSYAFQPLGRVNGGTLTFPLGSDMVEIVSRSNVLKTAETGTVWVYRDPASKPSQSVNIEVGFAEDVLPKR